MHLIGRALAAYALTGSGAVSAQSPVTTTVPDAPACASCRIVLRTVATLGTEDGPGMIVTAPNGIAVDGRGRYWITQETELPIVFDSAGRFVRSIGAKGDGPGEFRSPYGPVAIPGDSVLIFDMSRIAVISPGLRAVRVIRMVDPIGRISVIDWPASTVSARGRWGRDMTQASLQRVRFDSAEARVTGEFGPDRGVLDARTPLRQVLAPAAQRGRVWSADRGTSRYRLSQWDGNGQLTRSLERKPDWFVNANPTEPQPYVSGLGEDAGGTLWVFTSVAAPTWREATPPPPSNVAGAYEVAARVVAFEKMYRSRIEAIDPAGARLLAHLEHNEWVFAALPGNRAAIYTVDDDGFARIRIVEVTLARR